MLAFSALPLTLYIHVPWCLKKCPYCDFNSHAASMDSIDEDKYVQALLLDLQADLPKVWGRRIHAIFIGGGTPSMLSANAYKQLLSGIRALIPLTGNCEITMEANPGTFESERFEGYRKAGINRLSIGIQSFSDDKLTALGRVHGADEAFRAVEIAKNAGFENINLDIMFALPEQTIEQALDDITTAIEQQTTHLSWYQLTLEPNTAFFHQPPILPEDDLVAEMMQQGKKRLAKHGYHQYEISAYSKNKQMCQHNLNYWRFGDYLGIGAGAHSKISDVNSQTVIRQTRYRLPKQYLSESDKVSNVKTLDDDDLILEYMMNHLRIYQEVDATALFLATGLDLKNYQNILDEAESKGLIEMKNEKVFTTERGKNYLNELLLLFS